GTLMDRMGSSLDRSLLVAELLRQAGQTVRLVRARLDEAQAKLLLAQLPAIPPEPLQQNLEGEDRLEAFIQKYSAQFQLNPTELRRGTDASALEASRLAEDTLRRTEEQTPVLAAAVGKPSESDVKHAAEAEQVHQ